MTTYRNTDNQTPAWCRKGCTCGRERGSATRAQMRVYALDVTVALVGRAACVHCGDTVTLHRGEVDRTAAGCYRPGFVVMTCEACNNGLGQSDGSDFDRARYAADVLRASLTVPLPKPSEAVRAYAAKPDVRASYQNSPYAR